MKSKGKAVEAVAPVLAQLRDAVSPVLAQARVRLAPRGRR